MEFTLLTIGGGAQLVIIILTLLGLIGSGAAWLAQRDVRQEEQIVSNLTEIRELDLRISALSVRLFGHPEDRSDDGYLTDYHTRGDQAADDIETLEHTILDARLSTKANGRRLENLEQSTAQNANETRDALVDIQTRVDELVDSQNGLDDAGQ